MNNRRVLLDFPIPVGMRKRAHTGAVLHCCVVCGALEPWSDDWSWYGSYEEMDDGVPLQKFCSQKCVKNVRAVTIEMCAEAREHEYRSMSDQ